MPGILHRRRNNQSRHAAHDRTLPPAPLRARPRPRTGMVKRIRGVAYSMRVSPQTSNRLVDGARGVLNALLADVYVFTDHMAGAEAGASPGYGLALVAETTAGRLLSAEAVSPPLLQVCHHKSPGAPAAEVAWWLRLSSCACCAQRPCRLCSCRHVHPESSLVQESFRFVLVHRLPSGACQAPGPCQHHRCRPLHVRVYVTERVGLLLVPCRALGSAPESTGGAVSLRSCSHAMQVVCTK